MEEAVLVTDKWGFITLVNDRAVTLTGWQRQKAVGKALGQVVRLLHGASRKPYLLPLHEILLQPTAKSNLDQLVLVPVNGSETPVRFRIAPMTDSDGEVNGVILKFQPLELGRLPAIEARATEKPTPRTSPARPRASDFGLLSAFGFRVSGFEKVGLSQQASTNYGAWILGSAWRASPRRVRSGGCCRPNRSVDCHKGRERRLYKWLWSRIREPRVEE